MSTTNTKISSTGKIQQKHGEHLKLPATACSPQSFLVAPPGVGFSTQPVIDVERAQMEVAPSIMGARSPRLGPCTAACVERVAEVSPILLVPRLRRVFGKRLLERRALLRTSVHPPVHSRLPGLPGLPGRGYCPALPSIQACSTICLTSWYCGGGCLSLALLALSKR